MNTRTKQKVVETIVTLYTFLFIYAAANKFLDRRNFRIVLEDHPLLKNYIDPVVIGVPTIEILIVLLLIIPRTRLIGLYAAGILMTIFTAYLTYMMITMPKLPCSCGGILNELPWVAHIWFNAFFVALAILGIVLHKRKLQDSFHDSGRLEFHQGNIA